MNFHNGAVTAAERSPAHPVSMSGVDQNPTDGGPLQAEAVELARSTRKLHARRAELIGEDIFFDPAWNMLLDLVVSEADGRRLGVTALCLGSRCPTATAIRYIGLLEAAGMVARSRDVRDARRSFIDLTCRGRALLSKMLIDGR